MIFDEDTPAEIVKALQPDVLVKGADWPADQIVGRDTVEARGGRVVLVPVEQGHSTTTIVERVRQPAAEPGLPLGWSLIAASICDTTFGGMIVMLCSFRACASAFAKTSSASFPTITVSQPGMRSPHFRTFAMQHQSWFSSAVQLLRLDRA